MSSIRTSHSSPAAVASLVAMATAMVALALAYGASPAQASLDGCTTTGDTTTCTYVPSSSEDTFEVPDGVSSVQVVATGAAGADGSVSGPGGGPARVSGDLAVTPGQTLYVNVGSTPTSDDNNCDAGNACIGGFNGGGSSLGGGGGGGGGGASDVRTVATPSSGDQSESLNSRLIVAAGGGGAGATRRACDSGGPLLQGGPGGPAGEGGSIGFPWCGSAPDTTGGGAGGQSAGGSGGDPGGQSGSLGLGGNGGGAYCLAQEAAVAAATTAAAVGVSPPIRLEVVEVAAPTWYRMAAVRPCPMTPSLIRS